MLLIEALTCCILYQITAKYSSLYLYNTVGCHAEMGYVVLACFTIPELGTIKTRQSEWLKFSAEGYELWSRA
jgi:hypothetical protein